MPPSILPRSVLSNAFVLTLCGGMILLFFKLISPYAGALVAAVTIGIVFFPIYRRLGRWLPRLSASFRSLAACTAVALFFVVPLTGLTWLAVDQSRNWSPVIREWQIRLDQWREGEILDAGGSRKLKRWLGGTFGAGSAAVHGSIVRIFGAAADRVTAVEARVTGAVVPSMISIGVMLFTLFFIFRDGEAMYHRFQDHLPLEDERKQACTERLRLAVTGVLRGWLLCAMLQGVVASMGYLLAGVNAWVVLGVLTMLAGLIPVVGTALVWCPATVYLMLQGDYGHAVFLFAWGVFVVGLIDNLLRPYLIGQGSDVSVLFLFLSIIGGLNLWGMKGVILGPVLVSLAPVLFDAYRDRFLGGRNIPLPPRPSSSLALSMPSPAVTSSR